MESKTSDSYINKNILELKKESEELENNTSIEIEKLKSTLESMADTEIIEDDGWSPRLDEIELYTMEKLPPLSESIRRIFY